jgi:hypothetical protein
MTPTTSRSPSLDEQLRFAIANKRLLQVGYGGRRRVVEPHDYGVHKGTAKLLVYQLYGARPASGDRVNGWRLLELVKIEACDVLDRTFRGSRGASHQRHYAWDILYARVE